jgi:hypothetical protein
VFEDVEGGAVETEEADAIECLKEWRVVVGVVAEVGVDGSDSRASDWELVFRARAESFSFFFLKNLIVGIQDNRRNFEKGGGHLSCASSNPFV